MITKSNKKLDDIALSFIRKLEERAVMYYYVSNRIGKFFHQNLAYEPAG